MEAMRTSSKIAGVALLVFLCSLPFLAKLHAPPEANFQEEALKDFYVQTVLVPAAILEKQNRSKVEPCLLGARRCSELHEEPVVPCLLSGARCSGDAKVTLLHRVLEP